MEFPSGRSTEARHVPNNNFLSTCCARIQCEAISIITVKIIFDIAAILSSPAFLWLSFPNYTRVSIPNPYAQQNRRCFLANCLRSSAYNPAHNLPGIPEYDFLFQQLFLLVKNLFLTRYRMT